MKYEVIYSKRFSKNAKKLSVQDKKLAQEIIDKLANGQPLEPKHRDHKLKGNFTGCRECHIKPDLLLIYKKQDSVLILTCLDIGSHSELF